MVKISLIEVTARGNYPIMGKPNLHLWEVTLQTLAKQSFTDFEYIVSDIFYEERKDYFKDHNYGLKIKHIPAAPNIWHEQGLCQICHQFNKGIIHADGELLFFCADSNMMHPRLMENLWKHYQEGWFITLGFGADVSYGPAALQTTARTNIVPTEWYRFLDFHGHVHMDQRYNFLFENRERKFYSLLPEHHNWYYGISTVSTKAALEINGFNECFDPDVTLSDVDFGERLAMAGYDKIGICPDCYTIEAYAGTDWHEKMKPRTEVKCTNALLLYNQYSRRYRANEALSQSDIDQIVNHVCRDMCEVKQVCRTLPHRGPFYNKLQIPLYRKWLSEAATYSIDLEFERELRKSGDAYQEGTFVNC